jgi:PAS domain S-box-containing protein
VYIDTDEQGRATWGEVIAATQEAGGPKLPEPGTHFRARDLPLGRMYRSNPNRVIAVPRIDIKRTRNKMTIGLLESIEAQAMAFIPLMLGDRLVGLICLLWSEPHEFPDQEIQFYQVLSPQLAAVVDNRRLFEATRYAQERFRDIALSTSDWLWETDAEHRFTWFSPKDLVEVRPEWYYGKTRREIMAPAVDPELIEAHWQVLEAHAPFRDLEYLRRGPDGDAWLSTSGVPIFDQAGRFRGYRGVSRNISDRKSVEAELAHLAHHDGLTMLANRHTMQRQLEQALSLATRQQKLGALLLFDLDSFKEINDVHGHLVGDQLLRVVASRLRPAIRESDSA